MLYLPVQATPGDRINFKTRNPFNNIICPLSTFTKTRNVTYPMSAPPQTREQIAPGILLSSKTLAIILESKMQKFQRFLTGAHKRQ